MKDYDYQLRSSGGYVLPQTVFKQAVWAVKDLPRLRERYEELKGRAYVIGSHSMLLEAGVNGNLSDTTAQNAVELVNISNRIKAIEDAIPKIPLKYREGVLLHLTNDVQYDELYANIKTWRKWQQVFIYHCAANLMLI